MNCLDMTAAPAPAVRRNTLDDKLSMPHSRPGSHYFEGEPERIRIDSGERPDPHYDSLDLISHSGPDQFVFGNRQEVFNHTHFVHRSLHPGPIGLGPGSKYK